MSLNTANLSFSLTRPIATPATAFLIGTPPSINDNEPAHTVAIEEEPFDSRMSEINLDVYGNTSSLGKTIFNALSAR